MAEKQCNLLKNGGGKSKWKVVATAAANQTYASQLTYLNTYFQQLSLDEKYDSFLYSSSGAMYSCNNPVAGVYIRTVAATTNGALSFTQMYISGHTCFNGSGNPLSNISSNTTVNDLMLIIRK